MKFEAGGIYNLEDVLEEPEEESISWADLLWFLFSIAFIVLLLSLEGAISPPFGL